MKNLLYNILCVLIAGIMCVSCIEDGYTSSPSDQPVFSTDMVDLGVVFTDQPTTTTRFTVHNPHGKQLSISDIRLSGAAADCFRLNVDGMSGSTFSGVDIRGNDSIFVLVEATFPEGPQPQTLYSASIDFTTNGVVKSLPIQANGQNVHRLRGVTLDKDTRFDATLPYQVFDSLVVAPDVTLTLAEGSTLCFHDGAMLIVRGTLVAEGTNEAPVTLAGDRTGNVVTDISFDIMSRQWTGVVFTATSTGNILTATDIRNTTQGVIIAGDGSGDTQLTLTNCRFRNSGGMVLEAYHSAIDAAGCEFAEAADGLVYLQGGRHSFVNCTFANYYLFSAIAGPAIQTAHISPDEKTGLDDGSGLPYTVAAFDNCIIYGLGGDLSHGDYAGTDITFRRCLLKSKGSDDDNFIECIWGEDPLYYTVREDYLFDYRLRPDSPAIGVGDPSRIPARATVDRYGEARTATPALGAYAFTLPTED
ncbi:MAG: hypothetical protein K2M55_03910 [Muribaculaceae bacterium]|nr:hypothetical protein [Muribaculaceae bacterium]